MCKPRRWISLRVKLRIVFWVTVVTCLYSGGWTLRHTRHAFGKSSRYSRRESWGYSALNWRALDTFARNLLYLRLSREKLSILSMHALKLSMLPELSVLSESFLRAAIALDVLGESFSRCNALWLPAVQRILSRRDWGETGHLIWQTSVHLAPTIWTNNCRPIKITLATFKMSVFSPPGLVIERAQTIPLDTACAVASRMFPVYTNPSWVDSLSGHDLFSWPPGTAL